MAFPVNPVNNQTAVVNGINYTFNATNRAWSRATGVNGNVTIGNLTIGSSITWSNGASYSASVYPKIANIQQANVTYVTTTANAVSNSGGYIVVNGSGFQSGAQDRKSTRLNSSHIPLSRMPSSA